MLRLRLLGCCSHLGCSGGSGGTGAAAATACPPSQGLPLRPRRCRPLPQIPAGWVWLYYANPISYTLYGLIVGELGNVQQLMQVGGWVSCTQPAPACCRSPVCSGACCFWLALLSPLCSWLAHGPPCRARPAPLSQLPVATRAPAGPVAAHHRGPDCARLLWLQDQLHGALAGHLCTCLAICAAAWGWRAAHARLRGARGNRWVRPPPRPHAGLYRAHPGRLLRVLLFACHAGAQQDQVAEPLRPLVPPWHVAAHTRKGAAPARRSGACRLQLAASRAAGAAKHSCGSPHLL